MSLDVKLVRRLQQALAVVDDHAIVGSRLSDDAIRIVKRIKRFEEMGLVAEGLDVDALELASYALQLPVRRPKTLATGKQGRTTLKERAEEAAELLAGIVNDAADEALLDRATRVLHEMPHRTPMLDESKLLADAVNLEDFGAIGAVQQITHLTRQGEGVLQLIDGLVKREAYGYWDARLRDGFHFEPIRQIARRRLENLRTFAAGLAAEMHDDGL